MSGKEDPYDFSDAAQRTNKELAGELAKLSPLTAEELAKLLPNKDDKARFAAILKIVNSAASHNTKVSVLSKNFNELGGVMIKVMTKYLKPT